MTNEFYAKKLIEELRRITRALEVLERIADSLEEMAQKNDSEDGEKGDDT